MAGGTAGTGGAGASGGSGGAGGGNVQPPACRTAPLVNPTAVEKVNAAFCFGLAYTDAFQCSYRPENDVTVCLGNMGTDYVVGYSMEGAVTVGDVYLGQMGQLGAHLARIVQGATGAFLISWDSGMRGECTVVGDVATLCVCPAGVTCG